MSRLGNFENLREISVSLPAIPSCGSSLLFLSRSQQIVPQRQVVTPYFYSETRCEAAALSGARLCCSKKAAAASLKRRYC